MSSVDTIQKFSSAFLWPSREALPLMKQSIENDSYSNAFEARVFFVAQAISSLVAIPLVLIASFFIMLRKLCHCEGAEAISTIPAGIISSVFHLHSIVGSLIYSVSPMDWSGKTIDCFEFEKTIPSPEGAAY